MVNVPRNHGQNCDRTRNLDPTEQVAPWWRLPDRRQPESAAPVARLRPFVYGGVGMRSERKVVSVTGRDRLTVLACNDGR